MSQNLIIWLFIYTLVLLIICGGDHKINNNDFYIDYLSIDNCKRIKGFSCLMVLICHISNKLFYYNNIYNEFGKHILCKFGFLASCTFFFISGYGLMKQYKIKKNYLNNFLSKRLIKTLIPYFGIIIIYIMCYIVIGKELSINWIISDSNTWFCLVIIAQYILFYIFAKLFKKNYQKIIFSIGVCCTLWILIAYYFKLSINWYHSCYSIVFGLLYATKEVEITRYIKSNYLKTLIKIIFLFLLNFIMVFISMKIEIIPKINGSISLVCNQLSGILWNCIILLISLKIKSDNMILNFLGKYSYEIYMIHGLFILLFKEINNYLIFNTIVISMSIITAVILHKLFDKIIKRYNSFQNKIAN